MRARDVAARAGALPPARRTPARTTNRAAGFSEETARRVDDEIRALVMRGYETARQIVERQRPAVKALAEELLDIESVDADRLRQIVAEHVIPAKA